MRLQIFNLFTLVLLFCLQERHVHSAWWGWTGSQQLKELAPPLLNPQDSHPLFSAHIVKALEAAEVAQDHSKALALVKQARIEILEHSCWHHAYASLFTNCRQIINDEEKKARLALKLTDCFLRVSGRSPLVPCPESIPVSLCTQGMNEHVNSVYLAFFIDVASACHRLQTEAFILETKVTANLLKSDTSELGGILSNMELQSNQIFDQAQTIVDVQRKLRDDHVVVQEGIIGIQDDIEAGATILKLYVTLTHEQLQNASSLQEGFADQQQAMSKQQYRFSETLAVEFSNLKTKTGDIDNSIKWNLIGQGKLLSGQAAAMAALNILVKLHIATAEEIRSSIESIAKEDLKNWEELQAWQRELEAVSMRMGRLLASMRRNQETLSSKASHMFALIESLFAFNLAIIYESQMFRTTLFYVIVAILIWLVTAAKETRDKREFLFCASFIILGFESLLLHSAKLDVYTEQTAIFWIRGLLLVPAWALLIHGYLTYRDDDMAGFLSFQSIQRKLMEEAEGHLNKLIDKGGPSYPSHGLKQNYPQHKSPSQKILNKALSFQRKKRQR
ncbi:hypothetical protein O6H91_Y334400 [Diphasiastrum complanatum]|nr:hypothetical protein O6H91_Y334400 [Diphasiastrum complanatum]